MLPLINPGDTITVKPTACLESPIQKSDIILFRSGIDKHPLVKSVHAVEGDVLKVDISKNTAKVFVNKEEIKNSMGKKFQLTPARARMIKLYEGTLNPNTFLVMGDQLYGTNDSSRVGLIHKSDIIGRITDVKR